MQSASPGMQKIANCKTKSALSSHERVLPLCPCNLWNCFTFAVFPLFFQDFHIRSHRQRCSFALRGSRWLFQTGKDLNQAAVSPQVEIKEINKTWEHAVFLKNFKLGTNFLLQCWWSVCDILSVTQWQNVKNGQGGLGGWGGERGQGQELLVDLKSNVAVYLKENVFVNCGWVGSFFFRREDNLIRALVSQKWC